MRKLPLFLLVVCFTVFVRGQESDTVKLVSPTELAIPVTSDVQKIKVFYTSPKDARISITDVGPLVAGRHIGFVKQHPKDYHDYSFDLVVDAGKVAMKAGEKYSGSLVYRSGTTTTVVPLTVTRPAPGFTATATPTDICFACGEPRLISVQITNSGQAPLREVTVGTVLMSDASRRHRWILPLAKGRRCGDRNRKAAEVDGKLVVEPCTSVAVDLRPGEARTISIAIHPPQYAGDYATTIELSAEGVPTSLVSLVTRVRGPWGGTFWPGLLFVLTVILGFIAALWLEHTFGGGGAAARTEIEIALVRARDELYAIGKWARGKEPLEWTRARIDGDLDTVNGLLRDIGNKSPDVLKTEMAPLMTAVQRRRKLQQRVNYALGNKLEAKLKNLDAVLDAGTPEEYDKELEKQLLSDAPAAEAMRAEMVAEKTQKDQAVSDLNTKLGRMRLLRGALLLIVSLITAYGTFYANGCNFGSLTDYFAVFLWALGLTQAGGALTDEVRSRAAAQPQPGAGGGGQG